ncbi:MAG: dimethyl sulfoxide reductase anchor subunit [Gammaproteobacteria bacterium]|nr:dimethyl sulfoxide reductase anchor subunit [Gammaproteobacteria bacterium]
MFETRKDEPDYAFIPDVKTPEQNRYGKSIELVDENSPLVGESLNINGDDSVGENPNRYKQHGFHFTSDNCIACHACEAACSEKNQLPAHISFRSVGYVEGGSYPAYSRMNISMACNHCDDPVCLKGCPTRAYTKFAEYGAVLQDPEICFGCGYCTWVCPYNAPQLDPVEGQVSKCNMCVDRLEEGLKPACAAACLGGALDFGLIETAPENREQMKSQIPGFPTPEITNPNIRFQQTRSLPREMTRPDTAPLRYQRDEQGEGEYKPKAVLTAKKQQWSLNKLRSREDPLVLFTLISQAVVGAFFLLFLGPLLGLGVLSEGTNAATVTMTLMAMLGLQGFALVISTMHLGKPHRFYRAFNNLKYSPVSREVASLSLFFGLFVGYIVLGFISVPFVPEGFTEGLRYVCGLGALVTGALFIYAMHKIYRIEARPYWNHWQVLTSFYGSMLTLGSVLVAVIFAISLVLQGESFSGLMAVLAWPMALGLILEAIGLYAHGRDLDRKGGEGAAAHLEQRTTFGYTYHSRNGALALSVALLVLLAASGIDGGLGLMAWLVVMGLITATSLVGRALFYVLVVPTTMPGAFFWQNQGFQEHARDSGLAEMPQVGVLAKTNYHHEHMARAKREIKEDLLKLKQLGVRTSLKLLVGNVKERLQDALSRTP